jgi:type II secretion system protein F
MPVYEYTALQRSGKRVKGIIDADSALAARQELRGSGVFPVALQETSSKPGEVLRNMPHGPSVFRRINAGELSAATRQLSILLGAGITLVEALDALIVQASNPMFKKVLAEVKESVNQGNSLASSLAFHPKVFSSVYVNMVRAGEASGSLDLVLDRLAEHSEQHQALKGRFRAALAYPVFMFFIGTLILLLLLTFIIPNIAKVFDEVHQTLPAPTIVLIGVSNFLKSFWWLVLCVICAAVILARKLMKTSRGRHMWDEIKLRVPISGPINNKMAMARFSRTLGSLLKSGVPLISGLEIVRNIVGNIQIAEAVDNAISQVEEGEGLAIPLASNRWFPPVAVQMISVGERSGELDNMLNKIADMYEQEAESKIMALTSILEPVMILIMGLVVGFIVVSILLPIFEMNQMIR